MLVKNELDFLESLIDLKQHPRIIELGCGAAQLARQLLGRHPDCCVTGLEVDQRQHAKNLAAPQAGLQFLNAGAQQIPSDAGGFDLALMLKSLHHVPLDLMAQALGEIHRVLRPGGLLYVSEPVFDGALNEVMRLFNDEQLVRAAAIEALAAATQSGAWERVTQVCFDVPVHYDDFADFQRRMMAVTYADHRLDDATVRAVRQRLESSMGPAGADFVRPMRIDLLRRR